MVDCSRCGKTWVIPYPSPGRMCDCHLYCSSGDKPSDCSVTEYNYSGPLGWPFGVHNEPEDESDDLLHATHYCATHDKYIHKPPVFMEVDWKRWFSQRAPAKHRMFRGNV